MSKSNSASKKTPAKKVASKPVAKVEHRTDYKAGARVKVIRRDGSEAKGFVVAVHERSTGAQIEVDIGSKQVPYRKKFRPKHVKGF